MSSIEQLHPWDAASQAFDCLRDERIDAVDYGPFSPSEVELHLLGDVAGLSVLDVGCGGGQNAVCLAEQGAIVTALDSSRRQLELADRRARQSGVRIRVVHAGVENLQGIPEGSQQLILCTNVLAYVEHVEQALASSRRALTPKGRIVISMDHPIRSCFAEIDSSDLTNYPERSYFDQSPRRWLFGSAGASITSYDRTIGEWIDLLHAAHFALHRLIEAPAPIEMLDKAFPKDGPLASLRNIPHTLIFVAYAT